MAINQFEHLKKRLSSLIRTALAGLVLALTAAKAAQAVDSPTSNNGNVKSQARPTNGQSVNFSQIKELAGKLLLDSQTEVTQPFQVDKYVNFVTVSTPTLTPASGHSLLFANSAANQFMAKYSDGTTQVLGGGSSGGAGTITGVTAGTDLTGGGSSGSVTLNVDPTLVLETSSATATYLQKSSATATYLNSGVAVTTYLSLSSATATYLQSVPAANTYLTLSSATATYLQSVPAGSTYLTQSSATVTYVGVTGTQSITGTKTFTSSNTFSGQVNISSAVQLSGSAGNAGQVLQSNGANITPTWATVSGSTGTTLTTYSPTISGYGTTSNVVAKYLQTGNLVMVWVTWQAGTLAGTTGSVTLPINVNSGLTSAQMIGWVSNSTAELLATNGDNVVVFYDGSTAGSVFFGQSGSGGSSVFAKANGNNFGHNNSFFSLYVTYPQ